MVIKCKASDSRIEWFRAHHAFEVGSSNQVYFAVPAKISSLLSS